MEGKYIATLLTQLICLDSKGQTSKKTHMFNHVKWILVMGYPNKITNKTHLQSTVHV